MNKVFSLVYVYTCLVPRKVRRGCSIPWNRNNNYSLAVTWVSGTNPRFSARASSTVNHWAISPVPGMMFFEFLPSSAIAAIASTCHQQNWPLISTLQSISGSSELSATSLGTINSVFHQTSRWILSYDMGALSSGKNKNESYWVDWRWKKKHI